MLKYAFILLFVAIGLVSTGKQAKAGGDAFIPRTGSVQGAVTPAPSVVGMPNGSLVRFSGSPTVYVWQNGQLLPFGSKEAFLGNGNSFSNVQVLPPASFNPALVGNIIDAVTSYRDGYLLKGSGPTVYIMFRDSKTAAPSPALIHQLGLSLDNVINVSDGILSNIPDGSRGDLIPIYRPTGI